jgi:hypothetical protein
MMQQQQQPFQEQILSAERASSNKTTTLDVGSTAGNSAWHHQLAALQLQ